MNKSILLSLLSGAFLACTPTAQEGDGIIDATKFLHPPVDYRSVPLYSLNDELEPEVIAKQMEEFRDGGFGGVFFHVRTGLLTDYLGEDWWKAIDAGVDAAEKLGIHAWFYDEDKWPSGFASGKIPRANPEFVSQCILRIDKNDNLSPQSEVVFEDQKYKYIVDKSKMGDWWFNGTTYTDLLSHDMTSAFIDTTYVPYVTRYKDKLGKVAFGMFTDEPQIAPRPTRSNLGALSYTPVMFEAFEKMHGYDLRPKLALLLDKGEGFEKVRVDYYRTIAKLFEENYTRQIGDYCKSNNFVFLGHFNAEETPSSITRYAGNTMAMYRHMQMPGMDHLGLAYGHTNTPKSVTSVANQYGIARRMSESYGISGHNMNFEDRKWILDWETLLGINFISPHLSHYSMKGERKRDYPPTFSAHQPYWRYNKIFEDYSARMCYAMSQGKYAARIAVVSPLESAYIEMEPTDFQWGNERNNYYYNLLNSMQNAHRDYDLADELIMADTAHVDKDGLHIGEMAYKAVVLPNMLTVRETTIDLMKQFTANGGVVYVLKDYPKYVEGVANAAKIDELKAIATLTDTDALFALLEEKLPSPFALEGENASRIWTHLRRSADGYILQMSNTSRKEAFECRLNFVDGAKDIALWNPVNGKSYSLTADAQGKVTLDFAQTQTWIVTTGGASAEADLKTAYVLPVGAGTVVKEIAGAWKGSRVDPNAVTLDFARYSKDGGKTYSSPEPVIGIHQRLRNEGYNGPLSLKFEIDADVLPKSSSLVLEQPHMYKSITVNGQPVQFTGKEYYCDHTFIKQALDGQLKIGANQIVLSLDYVAPLPTDLDAYKRYGTEIETIYLIGNFAVKAEDSSSPLTTTARNQTGQLVEKPINSFSKFTLTGEGDMFTGDLARSGYPFYAGEFILENTVDMDKVDASKRYFIKFPLFEAVVMRITVNGTETEPLVYNPYEMEITSLLKQGKNDVKISLTNSLRNLLGPHHHKTGEMISVGPQTFTGESTWTSSDIGEADWFDVRLKGTPGIWRDDYYMIPFGLLEAVQIIER